VTLRELRRQLAAFRRPSVSRAVAHLALSSAVYALLFVVAMKPGALAVRVGASVLAGLFAGNLFMLGHDACHGSFTRRARLDRVLGRLAFLSSYHPFSLWELSHNRTHHVFTNLRSRDFVWTPATKAEYQAMPRARRWMYRAYRTPLGLALYYPIEIWWPRHVWLRAGVVERRRASHVLDRALLLAFFALQLAVAIELGDSASIWLGVVVPWLVFNWLIGFVIYFNHTHPDVRWFADEREWSSYAGIIAGTTRLVFPAWTAPIASAIMNHVAHHVDPRISLENLEAAQVRIEELVPERVIVQDWSVAALLEILRTCKLYDYDHGCWLDYAGRPTTERVTSAYARDLAG
jgi:omega-6 fatty acid desaturase (delta-12 desaturase)